MPLKSFKPVTPANRYKMLPGFDEITKSKPEKGLLEVKKTLRWSQQSGTYHHAPHRRWP
jgi:ribosomal protein L2